MYNFFFTSHINIYIIEIFIIFLEITTIEGIINRSILGLNQDQNARRLEHPETAVQIDAFILSLEKLKLVETPFTFILEDISGNSHVENPNAPKTDPKYVNHSYLKFAFFQIYSY